MSKNANNGPNGVYDGAVALEPIVVRANAGDCIDVTLRNKLLEHAATKVGGYLVYNDGGKPVYEDPFNINFDSMPDLATGNAITGIVRRDRDNPQGMTTFQSNLMVPSASVGLHPTLVEYDVTRADGTNVGQNPSQQTAGPGEQRTYQWYAGHVEPRLVSVSAKKKNIELMATPAPPGLGTRRLG